LTWSSGAHHWTPIQSTAICCSAIILLLLPSRLSQRPAQGRAPGCWVLSPQQENTLFVWQVAVADQARGMNLGVRMICSILAREENAAVTQVHTTITPDNDASWGLFKKLARNLDCEIDSEVLFSGEEHFGGDHKDEVLVSIGPFSHQQVLSTAD